MIAITGANGQLGRLVIKALLDRTPANTLIAIVRDKNTVADLAALGVTVREADYDQPQSYVAALAGVEKLLLISSNAIGRRVPQHQAVINAAKQQGVRLLAYTSILHADSSPLQLASEHKATEALIVQSGVPYVLLRNGWYNENYTAGVSNVIAHGALLGVADQGELFTAARYDYAEAAAVVLTTAQHDNQVYELAGDFGFSLSEFAALIATASKQAIATQFMSEAQYTDFLTQVGLPYDFAALLADAEQQAKSGWLAERSGTLSRLLGRPTTPITVSIDNALSASPAA
ncbi:SDR family oxidoreductase [Pseudoalteromonas fenneropenaei]|uniref:SDR family oxidoreductase n=1 Tax=Pseudoalteromonas fenneropenaei TaxID=1737459 RepID=A0ABV7CC11_9GAMM